MRKSAVIFFEKCLIKGCAEMKKVKSEK